MPVYGTLRNRENPEFNKNIFLIWMPQYRNFIETEEGQTYFNYLYGIVNNKIFKSIYGVDWEYAMSLAIAHYLTLIADQLANPSGSSLSEIAGGGNFKGVLSSASVGDFSKSYDIDKTMSSKEENMFWNQTSYGATLMALLANKPLATITVIAPPQSPYGNYRATYPQYNNPPRRHRFVGEPYDEGDNNE